MVFASDDLFYNMTINGGNAIFTVLASQLVGYGFAGMFRSFLVYPTIMLYPINLIYVNLFDVLHRGQGKSNVMRGKRLRFFWILTSAIFVYEWFPEYIAPLLGAFNIVCLADRNSAWVSYIFGGAEADEGMGLLGFGVDWANITSAPFYLPLSTQISNYIGWTLCYLILPLVYYGNVWKSQNFPFISQNFSMIFAKGSTVPYRFFENGSLYDQNLILNPDLSLNKTAYEIYGQPYQSGSNIIYYLGMNIAIGATFVHIALWHGQELWSAFKDYFTGKEIEDAHYKKMLIYKEVPFWWYAAVFLAAFAAAMACIYTSKSSLPWWGLIVGLLLAAIMLPFVGAMGAITGFSPYMTPLFQMIGAGLTPGSSQANMYFELYSSQSLTQAQAMLSDLKLGQYTKLPPRVCFIVQIVGTIIGGVFNYVITQDVVNNERTILLSNEGSRTWSGQQVQSYNALAIMWGALGSEIFGPGGTYFIIPLGCVIGLGVPIIPWLLYKRFRWAWCKELNFAVIAYYIGDLAGGTNGYIDTWIVVGLFSHFYIRRYRAGWFRKYNYLLGAAVDGGSQIFVFIYAFAVGGAGGNTVAFPTWALNPAGNADYCAVTSS
ncbi:uncharacterized protein FIBRA_06280 [Fibroporia radiculosa]|uniref:OPT superfamily oligopeptide transporter n=1 Tax=Fibroporia radiculosa TaxID=599839 RepID=J4H3Z8_9APHY|nr:uncharacterized protein FIBRA_06280 [Fibroporia radiculosa]CCM04119.1 predicted protein [Fibroporia radiculosa]